MQTARLTRVQTRFVDCRPREALSRRPHPRRGARRPGARPDRDDRRRPPSAADAPRRSRAWASAAGIGAGTLVVGYDDGTGWAARLWWLLRHFGHDDAAVLHARRLARPARGRARRRSSRPSSCRGRATDDTAEADELLAPARRPGPDARRRAGAGALARRGRADRPGRRPDPGRPQPLLPGRVAAARRPARRRRARRLLRLGRDRVRRPARARTSPAATDARLYPGSFSEWYALGPVERD